MTKKERELKEKADAAKNGGGTGLAVKDPGSNLPAAPAQPLNFAADAGMGLEGADSKSFAIPFIAILQGLSPQLEKVDGAKPGLFLNTITNELFKEVLVIPCAFQRRFLRWAPRAEGGGYRGDYNPIDVELNKIEGLVQADGQYTIGHDLLRDTRNHFVLMQSETGAWQPAMLSLSSTQIKKSKRWLSRIQGVELPAGGGKTFNPPSFSHIYKLTTAKEENAKGAWWGVEIALVGQLTDALTYEKAKAFHKNVAAGLVEVATPVDDAEPEPAADGRF